MLTIGTSYSCPHLQRRFQCPNRLSLALRRHLIINIWSKVLYLKEAHRWPGCMFNKRQRYYFVELQFNFNFDKEPSCSRCSWLRRLTFDLLIVKRYYIFINLIFQSIFGDIWSIWGILPSIWAIETFWEDFLQNILFVKSFEIVINEPPRLSLI